MSDRSFCIARVCLFLFAAVLVGCGSSASSAETKVATDAGDSIDTAPWSDAYDLDGAHAQSDASLVEVASSADSAACIDADGTETAPISVKILGPLAASFSGPTKIIPCIVALKGNVHLAPPGTCECERCGHVTITIDGSDCNAPGQDFNAQMVATGPIFSCKPTDTCATKDINLAFCKKGPTGDKTIHAELRHDDGSAWSPAITDELVASFK